MYAHSPDVTLKTGSLPEIRELFKNSTCVRKHPDGVGNGSVKPAISTGALHKQVTNRFLCPVRDVVYPRDIHQRILASVPDEVSNLTYALTPVLLLQIISDLVPSVILKVSVDVRRVGSRRIKKPLEKQARMCMRINFMYS